MNLQSALNAEKRLWDIYCFVHFQPMRNCIIPNINCGAITDLTKRLKQL